MLSTVPAAFAQDAGGTTSASPPAPAVQQAAPASQPAEALPAQAGPASAPPSNDGAAAAATGTPASSETAQTTPRPEGCFVPPAKLPATDVEAFLATPQSVYESYGRTPLGLSGRVRGLAGSDPRTLAPILDLVAAANADQKAAIGAGLGRAAFACAQVDGVYAQQIQSRIADMSSPELLSAFVTASNDLQVAAAAGGASTGGAAAAAGLAGGDLAGPNSAGLGGDEVVPTTTETYSFSSRRLFVIDDDDNNNDDVSPAEVN